MGFPRFAGRQHRATTVPRPPSLGWTLVLTSLATFMVALDALVVITALPSIERQFNVSVSSLQWTINAYGLTWAAGIITAAALGDRFGRRRVFIAGVGLFTISSVACAMAPSLSVLIAARAVQGLGAAIILPLSLTILGGVFPPQRRGTMVGIWGGIGGLAIAIGPLVGGALTQHLSWHWVFWVNVPIGIIVAALSARHLNESHGPAARFDIPGVALVTSGAAILLWSLVRSSDAGWGSLQVMGGLVLGAALVGGFVAWENKTPYPMLPLRLFRNRSFSAANITSFAMTAALLSGSVYLTQYFQFVGGYSPLDAGVRLLPMLGMPLFVAPLSGLLSDRIGQRTLIATGLLVETAGLAWFALTATVGTAYLPLVIPLIMTGIGLGMALATTPTAALGSVLPADMGKASGTNSTLTRFGGAFGVAITTAAFTARGHLGTPASVAAGVRPALLAAAGFALLGAVASLAIGRPKRSVPVRVTASEPPAAATVDR